jgi:hypothetical protein
MITDYCVNQDKNDQHPTYQITTIWRYWFSWLFMKSWNFMIFYEIFHEIPWSFMKFFRQTKGSWNFMKVHEIFHQNASNVHQPLTDNFMKFHKQFPEHLMDIWRIFFMKKKIHEISWNCFFFIKLLIKFHEIEISWKFSSLHGMIFARVTASTKRNTRTWPVSKIQAAVLESWWEGLVAVDQSAAPTTVPTCPQKPRIKHWAAVRLLFYSVFYPVSLH